MPDIRDCGEGATISIGSFCSIARGVVIYLGCDHRVDWITTFPFDLFWEAGKNVANGNPQTKGDVRIGNDVWIGAEAMILSGVTIGDGAVIGARALVAKSVPPYAIVLGNPGKVVRKRFGDEEIEALLRIAWWDWDDGMIEQALPYLLNGSVSSLASFYESRFKVAEQIPASKLPTLADGERVR